MSDETAIWSDPSAFDLPRCVVCHSPRPDVQITIEHSPNGFGQQPRSPVSKIVHVCDDHYNELMNAMTRDKWTWYTMQRIGEETTDD